MVKTVRGGLLEMEMEKHMKAISSFFKNAKVTIVVNTSVKDAHLVMTQDDLDNAIGIIRDTQMRLKVPTCIKSISFNKQLLGKRK